MAGPSQAPLRPLPMLLTLAALALLTTPAASDPVFCNDLLKGLSTCPVVPTVANVDVAKYAGLWYEIGASAQTAFSFFGQRGGQCVTATYSALAPAQGRPAIAVNNRALAVTSAAREKQSRDISNAAASIGNSIKTLCKLVASPTSSVTSTTKFLSRQVTRTPGALPVGSRDKIAAEAAKIQVAADGISVHAGEIYDALSRIQQSNFVLSGSTLPAAYPFQQTTTDIKLQLQRIQTLSGPNGRISLNRKQILASSNAILKMSGNNVSPVARSALAVAAYSQNGFGALAAATGAIAGGAASLGNTVAQLKPEPRQSRLVSAKGTATQASRQKGALTVSFGIGGAPYNIVKLDGPAAKGYDVALVYGCTAGITTAFQPQSYFYLLSRTPTLPPATVTAALQFLKTKGVFIGGDNDFLTVSQDPQTCKALKTLK